MAKMLSGGSGGGGGGGSSLPSVTTADNGKTLGVVSGAWAAKNGGFVTPEDFGAKGDGTTDDTVAVRKAFEASNGILLTGKYLISSAISISDHRTIIGAGGEIISTATDCLRLADGAAIQGVKFTARGTAPERILRVAGGKAFVDNCAVTSENTLASANGVQLLHFANCDSVVVRNTTVKNVSALGDGNIANPTGSVYGVYCNDCDSVMISNVVGENIHNVNSNGNIILEDASCVYVSGDSTITEISDCDFRNCGKRAVKVQCEQAFVSGTYFYSDSGDNLCLLGIQDDESEDEQYGFVSGCSFVDAATYSDSAHYCLSSSEHLFASDCKFKTTAAYNVLLNGYQQYENCQFDKTALVRSTGNKQKFVNCDIARISNNDTGSDIVELHDCNVEEFFGLIEAYNSNIYYTVIYCTTDSTTRCKLINCHISSKDGHNVISSISNPCDIINCTVWAGNPSNARILDIYADCFIDGLRNVNPSYTGNTLGIKMSAGNITLKNCDILAMWFYWTSSYTSTFKMYPFPVESLPADSHAFPNAYVFNMADGKFYKFENGAWAAKS